MIFYLPIFLVPLQILVVQLGYLVHKAEMDEKFAFPNVTQISKAETMTRRRGKVLILHRSILAPPASS